MVADVVVLTVVLIVVVSEVLSVTVDVPTVLTGVVVDLVDVVLRQPFTVEASSYSFLLSSKSGFAASYTLNA